MAKSGDLGDAIYAAIVSPRGSRSMDTEPGTFGDAVKWFAQRAGGNVSEAARLAGVPRRTFRDWMGGAKPRDPGRSAGIVGAARAGERRRRLPAGREKRLRGLDPGAVQFKGAYVYDAVDRTVDLGRYLDDDAIPALIDMFLAGGDATELREVIADHVSGADFYRDTLRNGPTHDHGWAVTGFYFEGAPN